MTESFQEFRVAIIGAGLICPFHIAGIRRSGLGKVVALCDLDISLARSVARQNDIPHVVQQLDELRGMDIDVVHVATPPHSHFSLTMQALDMGCHVFVEKPLATSVEQCQAIRDRAAQVNRQVCANHSNLLDPFIARAIKIAQSGRIGDVHAVTYIRSSNYPPYRGGTLPPHYRDGGFPFRDLGVHALYMFCDFLGRIKDVHALFAHRGTDPNLFFDDWTGMVECERGTGLFHLSWNTQPLQNTLIVVGTRGVIRCEPASMFVTTRRKTRLPGSVSRLLTPFQESCQVLTQLPVNITKVLFGRLRRYHGVQSTIASFYSNLCDGKPSPVAIDDAIEAVRWTEHVASQADGEKKRRLTRLPAANPADVLVTGGTGFIGRHLIAALLKQPGRVRVLTRLKPSNEQFGNGQIDYVIGDLGDPDSVRDAVSGVKIVYHLGAAMAGSTEDFERATEVGTRNVVEAVLQQGDTRLVHISSLSVLHNSLATTHDIIKEDWPLEPFPESRGNYTLYKLRAEQLVSAAALERGLQAVIIRPGRVFGPDSELITPDVARRLGSRLIVLGDGSTPLPLVYVDDLIDALLAASFRDVFDGRIIQIVDDSASVNQNQLLGQLNLDSTRIWHLPRPIVLALAFGVHVACRAMRRRSPLSPYRIRSALNKLHFDSSKAHTQLGWNRRVGVKDGLRRCLAKRDGETVDVRGPSGCDDNQPGHERSVSNTSLDTAISSNALKTISTTTSQTIS